MYCQSIFFSCFYPYFKKEVPIALWVEKGLREPQSSGPIAEGTGWATSSNKQTQKNTFLGNKLPENLIFPIVECVSTGCFLQNDKNPTRREDGQL